MPIIMRAIVAGSLAAILLAGCGGQDRGQPSRTLSPNEQPSPTVEQSQTPDAVGSPEVSPTPVVDGTPVAPSPTDGGSTGSPDPAGTPDPADTPDPSGTADPSGLIGVEGRIMNPVDGYAITLPEGWQRQELTDSDTQSIIDAAGITDEETIALLRGQLTAYATSGLKFVAFRLDDLDTGFGTNVNILSDHSADMLSLEMIEQANIAQFQSLEEVQGEVESRRVELPSGEALQLAYTYRGADNITAVIRQYFLTDGESVHVLTVTAADGVDIDADAEAMVESFEFIDKEQ